MRLLTTHSVAHRFAVTTATVRYWAKTGKLLVLEVERGPGQIQRLFFEEDVLRFKQQREQARTAKIREKETSTAEGVLV
jgi:DNA-binding transcriptional MerR regulator